MNIWPWSTIRRLRDALADAKHEATLWETSYQRRAEAYDDMVRQRGDLSGQLTAIRADTMREYTQRVAEREELNKLYEDARDRNSQLLELNSNLRREVFLLQAQLAEAAKNDARDPKTGRFVKAER